MDAIKNIKNCFNTPELYLVFSACMYMPTWGKFCVRANEYMHNEKINIFGYYQNNCIAGIIVVSNNQGETPEIKCTYCIDAR